MLFRVGILSEPSNEGRINFRSAIVYVRKFNVKDNLLIRPWGSRRGKMAKCDDGFIRMV